MYTPQTINNIAGVLIIDRFLSNQHSQKGFNFKLVAIVNYTDIVSFGRPACSHTSLKLNSCIWYFTVPFLITIFTTWQESSTCKLAQFSYWENHAVMRIDILNAITNIHLHCRTLVSTNFLVTLLLLTLRGRLFIDV